MPIPRPISNADIAPTLAHIAGIELPAKGKLQRPGDQRGVGGRRAGDGSNGNHAVPTRRAMVRTILNIEQVGDARYFDAAGFAGKTVGLTPP